MRNLRQYSVYTQKIFDGSLYCTMTQIRQVIGLTKYWMGLILIFPYLIVSAAPPDKYSHEGFALTLSVVAVNPTCNEFNGRITATGSQGVQPYTYSINGGAQQSSGVFLYLVPGTYVVQVRDALGSTANTSVTLVNQFTRPGASISNPTPPSSCTASDASVVINGSGGLPPYTYSLDFNNFQSSNLFTNLTGGSYYAVVKDANGCLSSNFVLTNHFSLNPSCPIVQNGQNVSYGCNPFQSYLGLFNVNGGTAPYTYSLDGINYQSSSTFYPLPQGVHPVWVKDAVGTLFLFSVVLNDWCQSPFVVNTTAQPANCGQNGSITVTPQNGRPPYEYSINGGNYQLGNQFTGLVPSNYTIRVKDADNLIVAKLVTVKNNCITVVATAQSSTCGNSNGRITIQASQGTAPYTYSLNGVNFTPNNTFAGLAAASYTVYARDVLGATGSSTIVVGNIPSAQIININSSPADCSGNTGNLTVTAQGIASPFTYNNNGGAYQNSPAFANLPPGNYTIGVKDTNGCITTQLVVVALNNNLTVEAGSDVSICQGQSTTLQASSSAAQFAWSPTTGLGSPASATTTATPSNTTMYHVVATQGPCTVTDSVLVTVKPAPIATTGVNQTICFGKSTVLNGSGGSACMWQPSTYLSNANTCSPTVVMPNGNTTYSLVVTDANSCRSLNNPTVTINVLPPAQLFVGNDTSIAIGQPLPLTALDINQIGFVQYSWQPATGLNNPLIKNPIAILGSDITYRVKATTAEGCAGNDTINIKVFKKAEIFIPNAFSPNGDGLNDLLKAIPVGVKTFHYLKVYDRYGQLVFYTTNPAQGWDGTMRGRPFNTGSFVWMTSGTDFEGNLLQRKGSVTLIR
jgi:gliding motility-associated-like protein